MRAGYPPQAGVEAFEILAADAKLYERKQPTFFASHPSMIERAEVFREMIAALPPGTSGAATRAGGEPVRATSYRAVTGKARLAYLQLAVETGRQKSIVAMLEPRFAAADIDPASAYWLGEAYRVRGDAGDAERAVAAYRWVLECAPDLAAAWRGIGEIARRGGRRSEAIDALQRYLDGAPEALDREAVRAELERLQSSNEQEKTQ